MDPNEKLFLKIRENFPTKPFELNLESTGIAQEEPVSFKTADQDETREKKLWKRKKETLSAVPSEPPIIKVSCYYANDLQKRTTIVNIAELNEASRVLLKHFSDSTLLSFKRQMLGLPVDERLLINAAQHMQYSRNKDVLSSKAI